MNGPEFYTPDDVPEHIRVYDSIIRQLGVGKTGKTGHLRLVLENHDDKTVMTEQISEVPLCVQRALYCEDSLPGMAYLYMASVSGGILQGDRYRIDITLKEDSTAHITTQGATRIYGMDSDSATQIINIKLERGSYLEFIPDQIIPYENSRFYQRTNLTINDGATLVYSEIVSPGRTAMGESFAYDVCYLKTRAENQDGLIRFIDAANLEPKSRRQSQFGILGEYDVMGSIYIVSDKQHVRKLYNDIHLLLADYPDISIGTSRTRDDSGLLVRLLGCKTDYMRDMVLLVVSCVRDRCMNASLSEIRKS